MRILVGIWHPAHVHFFKNMIWNLEKNGHEIKIVTRPKEVTLNLLNNYGFNYELVGVHHKSTLTKAIGMIKIDYNVYKTAKKFKPDILTSIGSPYEAHTSKLIGKPYIAFDDSEPAKLVNWLTFPFATTICTPTCFNEDLGPKQVRYNGYHELAYLHPNYFKPDPSILSDLDLNRDDKFIILRFVAWQASHDIGHIGFTTEMKLKIVEELEKHAKIFITSESKLPGEFERYRVPVPPERIHDMLHYATMLVGDTQTMTTEAAILGTPAIRCNSFVGPNDMGNFIELEKKYDLIYSRRYPNEALDKVLELLQNTDLKKEWKEKSSRLIKDKIDVTAWMTEFIENYPESFYRYSK